MKRNLVPFAMVLIGLTMASTLVAAEPLPSVAAAPMPAPGKLVWSDEFDGPAGARPDAKKWRQETGGSGWGNGELQYYTDSAGNASLDGGGNLAITARRETPEGSLCHYGPCEFTSARLLSVPQLSRAFGRFEARLKVPKGQGFWSAFWMLGDNIPTEGWPASGEIDVMEHVGQEPRRVFGSLHGPGYSGARSVMGGRTLPGQQAVGDAFHVFTVDWAPDSVTWFVDGVQYLHKTRGDLGGNPWVFDHKFFLLLNLAVGGYWPGPPDGGTQFPQSLLVDYVRVYEPPAASAAGQPGSHRIQGFAGKCIDADGGQAVPGAALVLRDCGLTGSDGWTFDTDGTVRLAALCMEAAGDRISPAGTALLRLAECSPVPAQRFALNAAGDLVNLSVDKCVDVIGWSPEDGAPLQLWDCAGSVNQKWWRDA